MFKVLLGPFGSDVALMNVTFPSEVLSVADCKVRGINVLEHTSPNSSSKFFTLEVPFMGSVVLQTVCFPQLLETNCCLAANLSVFPHRKKWG